MADRNAYIQPQIGLTGDARTMRCIGSNVSLLTTDLAINRTVALCVAPKGFQVTSISIVVSDMDTNGSPTLVFTIGDTASANRLCTVATTAQAGGTLTALASTGLNYEFTADTEINWTTTTAAATAAAGTAQVRIFGFVAA